MIEMEVIEIAADATISQGNNFHSYLIAKRNFCARL